MVHKEGSLNSKFHIEFSKGNFVLKKKKKFSLHASLQSNLPQGSPVAQLSEGSAENYPPDAQVALRPIQEEGVVLNDTRQEGGQLACSSWT